MGRRNGHKTQQLCRQVEQCLSLVLAGELEDPHLEGLMVVDVSPLAGSSLLRVEVALPPDKSDLDPSEVHHHLLAASGYLRREIAAAIHRKKTPQLTFKVVLDAGQEEPGFEDDDAISWGSIE